MPNPLFAALATVATEPSVIQALYEEEGLPLPYLRTDIVESIVPLRRPEGNADEGKPILTFAAYPDATSNDLSPETPRDLYPVDMWLNSLLHQHEVYLPFAAFGFAGHGFASQAVHYYLATPQVVILLQKRWGSILDGDPAVIARSFETDMVWTQRLDILATDSVHAQTFPEGKRLIVVESTFGGYRWGWVPSVLNTREEVAEAVASLTTEEDMALFKAMLVLEEIGKS